jgi:hypothetical protein
MKSMIIIASFLVAGLAHAEGAASAPAASAPAATEAKKVDKKTAKAECLKGDKTLKGEKLKECIKSKQM